MRREFFLALILSLISALANAQDTLQTLDGVWTAVSPPGSQIVFNAIAGGLRQANLPVLGSATVTVSDGRDSSNLKVSGQGFDCYYLFSPISASDEMTWTYEAAPLLARPRRISKK